MIVGPKRRVSGPMWKPAREERRPSRRDDAARVEWRCRVTGAHARQLRLEHATIDPEGWARWAEDGQVSSGAVQAGRCGEPPEVRAL
jgi:hypothetical protein